MTLPCVGRLGRNASFIYSRFRSRPSNRRTCYRDADAVTHAVSSIHSLLIRIVNTRYGFLVLTGTRAVSISSTSQGIDSWFRNREAMNPVAFTRTASPTQTSISNLLVRLPREAKSISRLSPQGAPQHERNSRLSSLAAFGVQMALNACRRSS